MSLSIVVMQQISPTKKLIWEYAKALMEQRSRTLLLFCCITKNEINYLILNLCFLKPVKLSEDENPQGILCKCNSRLKHRQLCRYIFLYDAEANQWCSSQQGGAACFSFSDWEDLLYHTFKIQWPNYGKQFRKYFWYPSRQSAIWKCS